MLSVPFDTSTHTHLHISTLLLEAITYLGILTEVQIGLIYTAFNSIYTFSRVFFAGAFWYKIEVLLNLSIYYI